MLRLQVGDHVAEVTLPISRLPSASGVQQRIVGRLVARDVEPHQLAPRAARPLGEQRAPSVEVTLVEIDQPGKAQFERRTIAAGADGLFRGHEVHVRHQEARLDARDIEGLRSDGPNARECGRPSISASHTSSAAAGSIHSS